MYKIYEALRNERELLDTDVAESAKISQAILTRWKKGTFKPKYETVEKIAKALNVPTSVFYEGVSHESDQSDRG